MDRWKTFRGARARRSWLVVATGLVAGGLVLPVPALAASAPSTRQPIRYADAVPNDPVYLQSQKTYLEAMNLPAAWDTTTGDDNLILAILDSGVAANHPDLNGRLVPGYDFVHRDAVPDDLCGHGTMVAGIAAASTNTSPARGVAGATWRGKIMPLKVMERVGSQCQTTGDDEIGEAIDYAVLNRASVINMSLGGEEAPTPRLEQAIAAALRAGVVVVAAAGNESSSALHYPAATAGVIAVGSTTSDGRRSGFSNYGTWVDVVGPGESIYTTTSTGGYGSGSGTSFAAPLVSAVALLVKAADPGVDGATIAGRLIGTTRTVQGGRMVDAAAAVTSRSGSFSTASANGSGYWMLGEAGAVFAFGGARALGDASLSDGAAAVDLEPTPSNAGYWIADSTGHVFAFGNAGHWGNVTGLLAGEQVTSLSASPSGNGYWLFTTRGRVFPFGDAAQGLGDLSNLTLNGPILDSIPTPTGRGYYMVGSDGGIFAFGDAHFAGSMGGRALNAAVQSLVPDPDHSGYWLVAADGGVFAFDAPFRGSMGAAALNAPVTGMVPFGNGYLMVATDGGAFNFSNLPFSGSLGASGPSQPVVSVAAKAAA